MTTGILFEFKLMKSTTMELDWPVISLVHEHSAELQIVASVASLALEWTPNTSVAPSGSAMDITSLQIPQNAMVIQGRILISREPCFNVPFSPDESIN
jgi:hypothetical protein